LSPSTLPGSPPITSGPSLVRRRLVFFAAACGYLLSQFYRSFLTVIHDDLVRDLGIGPSEFGALGSAWFFAFAVSQFPVGIALDKLGPRRTIAGMMLVAVAGALLFATASSHPVAIAGMALVGVGCAPLLMGALYFFAKTEPPARFAALGSIFLACGLIGSLIAATPLALLVKAVGWRDAIRIVALVTLVVAILNFLVFRDPPQDENPPGGSLLGDLWAIMRMPALWPILVMSFAISAPVFTERSLWVGPFFGEVYGLDLIERGNAVLALALAMTGSAIFSGPIASWIDNSKRVVFVANLVCGLAFLALGLLVLPPLWLAIVLMMLAGLFGVSYAVLIAHGRLFFPDHVIGRGITFINFVSIGGTGVAQLLSGHAVEAMRKSGLPPAETYANLHIAFGILLLVSVVLYARAPAKPVRR
jgi:predicted MFS family arabinose efflux permease